MKILYYLCAIGTPELNIKLNILSHNLNYLHQNIGNFDIMLNCYDSSETIYNFVKIFSFLDSIYTHNRKGVLTEVWLTNPFNKKISNYDYIIFILDDVKIININLEKMIEIKKQHNIQVLSPKVLNSTWNFMNNNNNCITFNNALEVYFLLLSPKDFINFSSINTIENKWTWGVDHLFGHYNIEAAVYMNFYVEHMLERNMSKNNKKEAFKLRKIYLKNIGLEWPIKDLIIVKNIINIEKTLQKDVEQDKEEKNEREMDSIKVREAQTDATLTCEAQLPNMVQKKIFIIGFNKTATKCFDNFFIKNNVKSIHHNMKKNHFQDYNLRKKYDKGCISLVKFFLENKNNGKNLLYGIDPSYIVFSDITDDEKCIDAKDFYKQLDKENPGSKFILNIRSVDDWIKSRLNHSCPYHKFSLLEYHLQHYKCSTNELKKIWRNIYLNHIKDVENYFRLNNKMNDLLIYNIDYDTPDKISNFLSDSYILDPKHFIKMK